jgi:hypothetical protein
VIRIQWHDKFVQWYGPNEEEWEGKYDISNPLANDTLLHGHSGHGLNVAEI